MAVMRVLVFQLPVSNIPAVAVVAIGITYLQPVLAAPVLSLSDTQTYTQI